MGELPRFISFRFLNYVQYEREKGELESTVRNTSAEVFSESRFTKFGVVRSSRGQNMVHIHTCYNNKFLTLDPRNRTLLVATADDVQDNPAEPSCTLFRFERNSRDNVGLFLQSSTGENPVIIYVNNCLGIAPAGSGVPAIYMSLMDLFRYITLPKRVVFKGDNGRYLDGSLHRYQILQFQGSNVLDPRNHHNSHVQPNGSYRLWSVSYQENWQPNTTGEIFFFLWVQCKRHQFGNISNPTFRPVRMNLLGDPEFALWSNDSRRYCRRFGSGREGDRLNADATNVPDTLMTVEEAIRERKIDNIRYHMDKVRKYGVAPVMVIPQTVVNRNFLPSTSRVEFSYEEIAEETFRSSNTWKAFRSITLDVNIIPRFVRGEVVSAAYMERSTEWNETKIRRLEATASTTAIVPPRSKMTVTLTVARGCVDVPYSYIQRDLLLDRTIEETDFHDGIFTGISMFEFNYDHSPPESLPPNFDLPTDANFVVGDHPDVFIVAGEPQIINDHPPKTDVISPAVDEDVMLGSIDMPPESEEDEEGIDDPLPPMPSSSDL